MSSIQNAYNILTQQQSQINTQQAQTQQQVVTEIQNILGEMIRIAGELAIELACTECQNAKNDLCSIAKKARELVSQVKKLIEIQRRVQA